MTVHIFTVQRAVEEKRSEQSCEAQIVDQEMLCAGLNTVYSPLKEYLL